MLPNREYLRTPVDAAVTAQRFGRDFRLAARLKAKGVNPYKKGQAPVVLVDLASKGSIVEPRGLPLVHSKLFNMQAAVSAYELKKDIEAFDKAYQPQNVVHITVRPPRDLAEGKCCLLDENGRSPIAKLRAGQVAFNKCVQRAIAELERRSLLVPLVVARHVLPHEGGSVMDLHAHLVAILEPVSTIAVQEYLAEIFGIERIWVSSVAFPDEQRNFAATANYPIWRLANQDWNEVDDRHLVKFFKQCQGLRSIEVLGPLRVFRQALRAEASTIEDDVSHQPGDELDWDQSWDAETGEVDAVDSTDMANQASDLYSHREDEAIRKDGDTIAVATATLLAPSSMSRPVVHGCHFAWLGLTRRYVASVSNYTTFSELQKYYDLDDYVAFAEAHVAETHNYLLKPAIPKTSSSSWKHQHPDIVRQDSLEARLTPDLTTLEISKVGKTEQQSNGNQRSILPEVATTTSPAAGEDRSIGAEPMIGMPEGAKMLGPQPDTAQSTLTSAEPTTPKITSARGRAAKYRDRSQDETTPEPSVTMSPTMPDDADPAGCGPESRAAKRSSSLKNSASETGSGSPAISMPDNSFTFQLAVRSSGEATATLTIGVPAAVLDAISHRAASPGARSSRFGGS